jgi:hypothetical protein
VMAAGAARPRGSDDRVTAVSPSSAAPSTGRSPVQHDAVHRQAQTRTPSGGMTGCWR